MEIAFINRQFDTFGKYSPIVEQKCEFFFNIVECEAQRGNGNEKCRFQHFRNDRNNIEGIVSIGDDMHVFLHISPNPNAKVVL